MIDDRPVTDIKGIGEKTAKLLKKLNIETVEDLIHHYPRCYVTYPEPVFLCDLVKGERRAFRVVLDSPIHMHSGRRVKVCTCVVSDMTDSIYVRWYNMPYLRTTLHQGDEMILVGTPVFKEGRMMLEQPESFRPDQYHNMMDTYQPVYPLTTGLSNKLLQKSIGNIMKEYATEEYLPASVLDYYDLMPDKEALSTIHFPSGNESLIEARRRIIFDEFFRFFAAMELVDAGASKELNHYMIHENTEVDSFLNGLPYELTGAQKRAIEDIKRDMSNTTAMNRLIQGDVGSGKTVVAMAAMLSVVKAGYQAVLMAPTEVLAGQHLNTFQKMLEPLGIRIVLLTGSMKASEKKQIRSMIKSGEVDIVIGTHALFQQGVEYHDLALVITDEQHRFGVKQREAIMNKGDRPHVLLLSATPIPRTLGMILYRNMDVSIMNEMPASRLPIKNAVVDENYRMKTWAFLQKEVNAGHQVYVICPMIEESESMDAENVEEYASNLRSVLPPHYEIAVLHGKLPAAQKDDIMERFAQGQIHVLVSTTVIEVGIDVPNATLMIIENADRFGLAQLHQLRGRVGRGKDQSYCIFVSESDTEEAKKRLSVVGQSNDGFYIANEDLKLRGPGQIFGTRQSGTMNFSLGDIYENADILAQAAEAVDHLRGTGYDFYHACVYSLDRDLDYAKAL